MSNIQYGLISKTDAQTLEKTIDLICREFKETKINTCCIGIFDGQTDRGIYEYITTKTYGSLAVGIELEKWFYYECNHTAIDNEKDKPILKPFPECNLIIGNSNEVYNQLEDNSQHLIVQDANHSYPNAIQDFFCYMRKVKVGGFMWWHDVAVHAQGKDWQRMGNKDDSDMSISVRKALTDIGLFDNKFEGWQFVMEDADLNDNCGGAAVFKKLY